MSRLLVELARVDVPKFRPYRGKPFTRVARRVSKSGFVPELVPSTSSGKLRTNSERTVFNLLVDLGFEPEIEPFAFKILGGGSSNGQIRWFVPDFYVNLGEIDDSDNGTSGVYVEVSMAIDLGNKHHKMRQVAEKYGKMIILVTKDNIESFIADPELLLQLISQARIEEGELEGTLNPIEGKVDADANYARLDTYFETRYKAAKARKPKKGRRASSAKKSSTKPSRDPQRRAERRALRKQANALGMSITEMRRQSERVIVRPDGCNFAIDCYVLKAVPSPRDNKLARVATSTRSVVKSGPRRIKSTAGPKPARTRNINEGPLRKAA